MNTVTRIAANIINRIANINNIHHSNNIVTNNINNIAVKRDAIMNTNNARPNTMARYARRACTLFAFVGLLGLANVAAKADVVVDKFVGPQDVYNDTDNYINPGVTAMQMKVHNTFNYGVSNVPVQTYIYFAGDVNHGWQVRAMPATTVSLAAGQSKWISVFIPNTSLQGQNLRGQYLYAKAICNNHSYWLNNFLDAAYNIQAQEISRVTNSDGSVTFSLQFTNICHIASPAMNVTVNYAPYADGDLGPKQPLANSLPQLLPGQAVTRTFTTRSLTNYSYAFIDSDIYLGSDQVLYQFRF